MTDDFLEETAAAAGVDYDAVTTAQSTATRVLAQAQQAADRLGVQTTQRWRLVSLV